MARLPYAAYILSFLAIFCLLCFAEQPTSPPGYLKLLSVDYWGNDIQCIQQGPDACSNTCNMDPSCLGFNLQWLDSWNAYRCCLKLAFSSSINIESSKFTTYVKLLPGYYPQVGIDYSGNDIHCDWNANSLQDCSRLCTSQGQCAAFNFKVENGQKACCQKFSLAQGASSSSGLVSFVKISGFNVLPNTDYPTSALSCAFDDLPTCKQKCVSNTQCVGIGWSRRIFCCLHQQSDIAPDNSNAASRDDVDFFMKSTIPIPAKALVVYLGARGIVNSKNPPQVDIIPTVEGVTTYIALSFFTDDKMGDNGFHEGKVYNPAAMDYYQRDKLPKPTSNRRYLIALYGDIYTYPSSYTNSQKTPNVLALIGLINWYNADGIELNIENGLTDPTFVETWCKVIIGLKSGGNNFIVSASPYSFTINPYKSLFQKCGSYIDWFDYQLYAEVTPDKDDTFAANKMVEAVKTLGVPWDRITIGFDSNTHEPRGLQLNDFKSFLDKLDKLCPRGINIFSAEDSQAFYNLQDISQLTSKLAKMTC